MSQQQRAQLLQKEGRLSLISISFQNNLAQSKRALAKSFNVPKLTLQTRLYGSYARHEIRALDRKLLLSKE